MSNKKRRMALAQPARHPGPAKSPTAQGSSRRLLAIFAGLGGLVLVVVLGAVVLLNQAPSVRATQISPATLQNELTHKNFTLLNVKTPYVGEIAGTDLYIPYDQLAARASELPKDKAAPIVVYCRAGNESALAVKTLLSLGYTQIQELAGGMEAWTADGGRLIQVAH
jgi:rhodanese-related sulfurtransferase